MLKAFLKYLHNHLRVEEQDAVLLAVSGGLDSTVMAHLFYEARLRFAMAHCNFQLRGEASNEDEDFVRQMAARMGVTFFTTNFETKKFAEANKISVQEAARELRYQWLNEIAEKNHYTWIATAHHQDDSVETLLLNLIKGCGLRGLHGILPKQRKVIRPLMFTDRKSIENWAKEMNLQWREDASNATDAYDRNKIRHHLIPEIEKINPAFRKTAMTSIRNFSETQQIFDHYVAHFRDEAFIVHNGRLCLKKSAFKFGEANRTLLYELLAPFGFNNQQVEQILLGFDAKPGGMFYSPSHHLLNDRELLIITPAMKDEAIGEIVVAEGTPVLNLPGGTLLFELQDELPTDFPKDNNIAYFDADKLRFPLLLRRWQKGDKFQPLGMGGKTKKVQDFFSDLKISRLDKEQVWILESQGTICWIVGLRTDERFKIDGTTKTCWKLQWLAGSFAQQHRPEFLFHTRKS